MIERKICHFTTYAGLLFASCRPTHCSLQTCVRSCLGSGKLQTLASPEGNLVEDKGFLNGYSYLPLLDIINQKSDKDLEMSVENDGLNKINLAGKMLNNSQTKMAIRKCLQANITSTSGVQKLSNGQHVSATSHFCLNKTHSSRILLNLRNCARISFRSYHILQASTSPSFLSLFIHKYLTRYRPNLLVSCFSLSSQTLSSTLNKNLIGISNVMLGNAEKSVSNGEFKDEVYGKPIAKGDYCGSLETFSSNSSCVDNDSSAGMRIDINDENSKETTRFNHKFQENNNDSHDIYAQLYFNLMSEENVEIQNGRLGNPDEETAQTFDNYAQMYSRLMKSEETDRGESEVRLTHIDTDGKAVMVDVGDKTTTLREARAEGRIFLGPEAAKLVKENKMKKGDVLTVAEIAGITAAKQTAQLIPLCHNINLTKVDVACVLNEKCDSVDITSLVRTIGVTGVEMEALTAVSIAALTVYDMCKAVTHDMNISDVRLVSKSGGKRHFQR